MVCTVDTINFLGIQNFVGLVFRGVSSKFCGILCNTFRRALGLATVINAKGEL